MKRRKVHNRFLLFVFALLLYCVPPVFGAGAVSDGLLVVGGIVNDARNIRASRNPNQYTPYSIISEPSPPGTFGQNLFGDAGIISALQKVGECDPDLNGLCCVLPNFCVPVAQCSADKVSPKILDLLKAVPTCKCPKGFKGDGRRQGSGCQNVDECTTGEAKCMHICQDLSPGYACGCRGGFRLATNGYDCVDIDECDEKIARCSQQCTNLPGNYVCACRAGYLLEEDGFNCRDVDECQLMDEIVSSSYFSPSLLSASSSASSPVWLPEVAAPSSSMSGGLSRQAAAAIPALRVCDYPPLCVNLPGAYSCDCPLGYRVNPTEPSKCLEINECQEGIVDERVSVQGSALSRPLSQNRSLDEGSHLCRSNIEDNKSPSQVCIDVEGAFQCACASGFEPTGNTVGPSIPTPSGARKSNRPEDIERQNERYRNATTEALALECHDINECLLEINPCTEQPHKKMEPDMEASSRLINCTSLDPVCVNTIGSYTCQCPEGFLHSSESHLCKDIDECLDVSVHLCDEAIGEQCVNTVGSYYCQCGPGYRCTSHETISPGGLIPITCEDVDECTEGLHSCVNGCRNTEGSYLCECPKGFTIHPQQRHQCVDINECDISSSVCPNGTGCINLPGSYICGCPQGYQASLSASTLHTSQLTKVQQRWLLRMNHRGEALAASTTAEVFHSYLINWESPEFSLFLATLQSELKALSLCERIDVCPVFQLYGLPICPAGTACKQHHAATTFSCTCSEGSRLSSSSAPTGRLSSTEQRPAISAGDGVVTRASQGQQRNVFLTDVLQTGFQLFNMGRSLQAGKGNDEDDAAAQELPNEWQLTDAANRLYTIRVEDVLTVDALAIRRLLMVGLTTNRSARAASMAPGIPLWIMSHLDWTAYTPMIRDPHAASNCVDINECLEGIDGDLRNVCHTVEQPCCMNLLKTGYTCKSKQRYGLLLQRMCPSDATDLSKYL